MKPGPDNLARTVVFDPVTQNMRATRYGLYEAGFREVEGYTDFGEFRERIAGEPAELVVADASDRLEVHDLVRALRKGELADNPFAVVFLTSWRKDADAISTGLRCGADDIIVRPFSSAFIEARIRTAIDNRKEFVVSSDYFGPDRRRADAPRDGAAMRLFSPPNTLKSAIKGDRAAMDEIAAEVEAFKTVVRRERAVRLAIRIGVEVELAIGGKSPSSAVYSLARDLYVAIDPADAEASKLAAAMVRGLSTGEDVHKAFKLARELAIGICVLCGDRKDGEQDYVSEIEGLLGNIQARDTAAA
jgi:DNA-binding response OmpR family regulator